MMKTTLWTFAILFFSIEVKLAVNEVEKMNIFDYVHWTGP